MTYDVPAWTIGRQSYAAWILVRREVSRYMNVWGQTLLPAVISAALFLFVFGHALGDRIGDFDGVPYLVFLVPGLVTQGAITSAYANNGTSLFDARRAGYIEDVLTSPLKDWQIVLSYVVAGATRGVAIGVLTLLVALPLASGYALRPVMFLYVLVMSSAAFSLIGIIAGMNASRWDHIFVPQTFFLQPLTFLGGVFYPVSALPGALATASKWNPILYLVDAQRAATLGIHDLPLLPSLLGMAAVTAGLYAYVLWAFGRTTKLRG